MPSARAGPSFKHVVIIIWSRAYCYTRMRRNDVLIEINALAKITHNQKESCQRRQVDYECPSAPLPSAAAKGTLMPWITGRSAAGASAKTMPSD